MRFKSGTVGPVVSPLSTKEQPEVVTRNPLSLRVWGERFGNEQQTVFAEHLHVTTRSQTVSFSLWSVPDCLDAGQSFDDNRTTRRRGRVDEVRQSPRASSTFVSFALSQPTMQPRRPVATLARSAPYSRTQRTPKHHPSGTRTFHRLSFTVTLGDRHPVPTIQIPDGCGPNSTAEWVRGDWALRKGGSSQKETRRVVDAWLRYSIRNCAAAQYD
ncbi:hypothetical protein CSUB01_03974 [Colletotrichum sublineola]|uniref:Uncharacterized protein n=1 Tax=Colletotrichum sublineola TaxID=1173701 RepID=A0A066XJM5_COLSU|nr:hypothetical protein CSUB01_03974 [Colletotrichum sublineola]